MRPLTRKEINYIIPLRNSDDSSWWKGDVLIFTLIKGFIQSPIWERPIHQILCSKCHVYSWGLVCRYSFYPETVIHRSCQEFHVMMMKVFILLECRLYSLHIHSPSTVDLHLTCWRFLRSHLVNVLTWSLTSLCVVFSRIFTKSQGSEVLYFTSYPESSRKWKFTTPCH